MLSILHVKDKMRLFTLEAVLWEVSNACGRTSLAGPTCSGKVRFRGDKLPVLDGATDNKVIPDFPQLVSGTANDSRNTTSLVKRGFDVFKIVGRLI